MSKLTQLAAKMTLSKDLGPERDYGERGRIRKAFSVFGSNLKGMLAVNLMVDIFALPLIVMFVFLMGLYEQNQITEAGYSFSGFLGIGYGLVDDTVAGINMIYGIRSDFFLYFFTPGLMILSIGLAGAYHCIRNFYWGVEVKVFKHFFRGIKLHWWKFLITFTYLGLVGTSAACGTIELMRLMATTGSASAGIWIWSIGSLLLGLLSMLFAAVFLPTSVSFRFGYKDYIKNSCISSLIMFLPNLILTIVLVAPMFLIMVSIVKYIVYFAMITVGASLYIMLDVSFGNFCNDLLVNQMYEYEQEQAAKTAQMQRKQQLKEAAKAQRANPKKGKKR